MLDISAIFTSFSNIANDPQWSHWPFGPGFGGTWSAIARLLFVAAILGFITLFLRILFGPRGIFRDHELDKEAAEMKMKALENLEKDLKNGNISESEYIIKKKEIES